MTLPVNKKSDISSNRFLNGFNETELFEVCSIGEIKNFDSGSILIKEGDEDQTIFLILQGSVKITRNISGQKKDIAILHKDDGLGDIAFIKGMARTATAEAIESSTIMVIDSLSMEMLKPATQLHIYKNITKIALERIDDLISLEAKVEGKNKHLSSQIRILLRSNTHEYSQSEIIQNILKSISRLPMYTSKLVMLLHEENIQIQAVVDQAKLDPSLVGVILKTINSAYYGMRNKISDVQHAIMLLGFNQVYQLVLNNGVKSTMPDTPHFQELQKHSIITSTISFEIGKLSGIGNAMIMSTIGLLHDIGKSVLLLLKAQHANLSVQ